MKQILGLALAVLVVASCAGSSSDPSVAVEDIAVPEPKPVELFARSLEGWEATSVASVCVNVVVDTERPPGLVSRLESADWFETPKGAIEAAVEAFGVAVVDTGCDADLEVVIEAYALSGLYDGLGTCFTGFDGSAAAVLSAPGTPTIEAQYSILREPQPAVVGGSCQTEPVVPSGRWMRLLIDPDSGDPDETGLLGNLFGDDLWRAISSVGWERGAFGDVAFATFESAIREGGLLTPESIHLAQVHLYGDDQSSGYGAALFVDYLASTYPEQIADLEPLIPYLVHAMANSTLRDAASSYAEALEGITGERLGEDAGAWWEWWEAR